MVCGDKWTRALWKINKTKSVAVWRKGDTIQLPRGETREFRTIISNKTHTLIEFNPRLAESSPLKCYSWWPTFLRPELLVVIDRWSTTILELIGQQNRDLISCLMFIVVCKTKTNANLSIEKEKVIKKKHIAARNWSRFVKRNGWEIALNFNSENFLSNGIFWNEDLFQKQETGSLWHPSKIDNRIWRSTVKSKQGEAS